jgi:putative peptidoglycan lipid II flippase
VIRVSLTFALGYFFALPLPRMLGLDHRWGTAGLTFSAGIAGWLEFALLRRGMHRRIGAVPAGGSRLVRLWLVAILAAAIGYGIKRVLPFHRPLLIGPCVLIPYAAIYLGITQWMGIASMGTVNRLLRRGR